MTPVRRARRKKWRAEPDFDALCVRTLTELCEKVDAGNAPKTGDVLRFEEVDDLYEIAAERCCLKDFNRACDEVEMDYETKHGCLPTCIPPLN